MSNTTVTVEVEANPKEVEYVVRVKGVVVSPTCKTPNQAIEYAKAVYHALTLASVAVNKKGW